MPTQEETKKRVAKLIDEVQRHVRNVYDQECAITLAVIRAMESERKFTLKEAIEKIEERMDIRPAQGDKIRHGLGLARGAVTELLETE